MGKRRLNVTYLSPRPFTILCYICYLSFTPAKYTKNQLIFCMTSRLVSKLGDAVEMTGGIMFIVVSLYVK